VLALKLEFCTSVAPAAAGRQSPQDYICAANAVSNQRGLPARIALDRFATNLPEVPVRWYGEMATPVPRTGCTRFCPVPILAGKSRLNQAANGVVFFATDVSRVRRGQEMPSVEEPKQFPAVDRRRNAGGPEVRREAGEIAVFQELGKALTSSLQLDQVLRTIMEKIDEFLRPDNWSLLLLDEAKQELYFELAVGTASQALKDVRVKMGQGIAGWVAAHGETVVVPDTSKDTRFFGKVDEKTKTETRSIVAVPVRFRDTCLGVIELINCIGPEGFDPRDLKLLEALSDFAAIALENARHVKRIHELTITDDCTTLYNARHMSFILETEIYRSQRYNYEFSLIFIDLDHFKQVNDTQGHLVGSRLLAEIGNSLKGHCRLIDFAFRYGGDEFVLLLPQTSKENAMNVAKRLHRLIRQTTWLQNDGLNIKLTASMGVASYPVDSRTKEGLLHLADEAMYLVKNTNRDSVAVANVGILPHLPAATAETAG
jgi:diguanylate cyclase (GGDEF)-like protein